MRNAIKLLRGGLIVAGGLLACVVVCRGQGWYGAPTPVAAPREPTPEPALAPAPAFSSVAAGGAGAALLPVGSVVAWLKSMENTPALTKEWVECNGQTLQLQGSPYNGKIVPNLNGADNQPQRFLRGASQSGAVGGAERHTHPLTLIDRGPKHVINVSSKDAAPNLPPYYEVTWIIKVL